MAPIHYFAQLSTGKTVLWCYLIWYLVTVSRCFDPAPRLWLNSVGISAVIGIALLLSVSTPGGARPDRWQTFRLFAMPFCVSSFSALIKDHGYLFIFPTRARELGFLAAACIGFILFVVAAKRLFRT